MTSPYNPNSPTSYIQWHAANKYSESDVIFGLGYEKYEQLLNAHDMHLISSYDSQEGFMREDAEDRYTIMIHQSEDRKRKMNTITNGKYNDLVPPKSYRRDTNETGRFHEYKLGIND
jgi:hypothetical protein